LYFPGPKSLSNPTLAVYDIHITTILCSIEYRRYNCINSYKPNKSIPTRGTMIIWQGGGGGIWVVTFLVIIS